MGKLPCVSWTHHSSKILVISFHHSRILLTPSKHSKHYTCNETMKNMPKILWTRVYFMTSIFLGCPKTCLKQSHKTTYLFFMPILHFEKWDSFKLVNICQNMETMTKRIYNYCPNLIM
jgi:hypothetical protein